MNSEKNNQNIYIIELANHGQFQVSAENIFKALELVRILNNLPSAITISIHNAMVKRANQEWVDVTSCIKFQ